MPRRQDQLLCAFAIIGLAAWSLIRWYFDEQAWVDDAWISFKYSRALISSEGLTYNLEDGPVEGFTNLAWVIVVAAAMTLGAAPELFARSLGILSHLAAIALVASLGWRTGTRSNTAKVAAAIVGAIPGATHGLLGLAGSGLETAFAALLIVMLAELTERPNLKVAVLVGFLLCTTRPDGLLFVGCWFGVVFLFRSAPRREAVKAGRGARRRLHGVPLRVPGHPAPRVERGAGADRAARRAPSSRLRRALLSVPGLRSSSAGRAAVRPRSCT